LDSYYTIGIGNAIRWLGAIFHTKRNVDLIVHLGYPLYFLYILGIWKILGVIAILIPKFSLLKEWAYAGFFFAMSGAAFSRIASGDSMSENSSLVGISNSDCGIVVFQTCG